MNLRMSIVVSLLLIGCERGANSPDTSGDGANLEAAKRAKVEAAKLLADDIQEMAIKTHQIAEEAKIKASAFRPGPIEVSAFVVGEMQDCSQKELLRFLTAAGGEVAKKYEDAMKTIMHMNSAYLQFDSVVRDLHYEYSKVLKSLKGCERATNLDGLVKKEYESLCALMEASLTDSVFNAEKDRLLEARKHPGLSAEILRVGLQKSAFILAQEPQENLERVRNSVPKRSEIDEVNQPNLNRLRETAAMLHLEAIEVAREGNTAASPPAEMSQLCQKATVTLIHLINAGLTNQDFPLRQREMTQVNAQLREAKGSLEQVIKAMEDVSARMVRIHSKVE